MTDKGLSRRSNQDYAFASMEPIGKLANLFIVADGMGGHKAGDFASYYSVSTFVNNVKNSTKDLPISIITDSIKATNISVIEKAASEQELEGMGTTFVVATISDNHLYVANIGDSRLYIIDDKIRQITRDHSLVEEMVEMGNINRKDARFHPNKNIITRAIGINYEIKPDIFELVLEKGNIVLMCSDGLTNMLSDEEIMSIVAGSRDRLDESVQTLIDRANEEGGMDNISVILVKL